MQIRHARRGARIFGLALAALAIAVPTASAHGRHGHGHKHHGHHHAKKDVKVQLLAINDLHGHTRADTPGTIQTGCCVKNAAGRTGRRRPSRRAASRTSPRT